MRIEQPARPRRRIVSLVPMVDVVMNLLFFFMLATTYTQLKPVALSLAGPTSAAGQVVLPRLRVGSGELLLDGVALDWKTLLAKLKAQGINRIVVEPVPGLPMQPLLGALDRLREAGVTASLARTSR